jgi:hypothetical protein
MGLLNDALTTLVGYLEDGNLPVIDDPRNLQPPAVIVEPPTITVRSANLVTCDFPVVCVAPPPSNRDAAKKLLDLADQIVALPEVLTLSGSPGIYTTQQGSELPSYQLTVQITMRR